MKNFQNKLDVIGNNIANVNTFGFKKGRVVFKDMVNQSISGASGATAARGGINPKQVGLGSQVSAIDTIQTQGSLQNTGRMLDLSLSGDGYFVLANGTDISYTRAGNFYLDQNGDLVNSDGLFVTGLVGGASGQQINIPTNAKDMAISQDGTVTYIDNAGALQTAGQIQLAKFPNSGGLTKSGNNLFKPTNNSGTPVISVSGQNGLGDIQSGLLEMSNVDLSEEFTEMITAQRGFQANTRIITTSDEILQELVNLKR